MGNVHVNRRRSDGRINLSSNELLSARVAEIHRTALAGLRPDQLTRYPVLDRATERIAAYFRMQPDELVLTPGSDSALRLIIQYHLRRGGGPVLLQDPNYAAWEQVAAGHGLRLRRVTAHLADPVEQGAQLVAQASATTGALIAVSVPNGLSGGSIPDADLRTLAEISAERGHLLVVDACYQAFRGPLTEQTDRRGGPVLVVQSLSKSHGLAGARVAVLAGAPDLVARLEPGPLEHAVSGLAVAAMLNAVDHHGELTEVWSQVRARREWCRAELAALSPGPLPSDANFVTAPVPAPWTSAQVTQRLSERGYRIRNLSGSAGLDNCVRFTVGDADITEPFIDCLTEMLLETAETAETGRHGYAVDF